MAIICAKYLRAYDNQFNWDINTNGESYFARSVLESIPGVVFDVGANVGTYTSMCLSISDATAVHSFEISPPTFVTLKQACANIQNARLNCFGLGAVNQEIKIYHARDSTDRTSILPVADGFKREVLESKIRTGDAYMTENRIEKISILKIDAEGADLNVLLGFSDAFDSNRIAAVQFEHGEPDIESRTLLKDKLYFLHSKKLRTFRLFPNCLEEIKQYDYSIEDFRGSNYVALTNTTAEFLARQIS